MIPSNFYYTEEDVVDNYISRKVYYIYVEREEGHILECDNKISAQKVVELLNSLPVWTPR